VRQIHDGRTDAVVAEKRREKVVRAIVGGDEDGGLARALRGQEPVKVWLLDPTAEFAIRSGAQASCREHQIGEIPGSTDKRLPGDVRHVFFRNATGQRSPTLYFASLPKHIDETVQSASAPSRDPIGRSRADYGEQRREQSAVQVVAPEKRTQPEFAHLHAAGIPFDLVYRHRRRLRRQASVPRFCWIDHRSSRSNVGF